MSGLEELRQRVEAATGADREIDAEIAEALRLGPAGRFRMHDLGDGALFGVGAYKQWSPPAYTASLDAVLALVGEKLPGWDWCVSTAEGGRYAGSVNDTYARAATPPLALLSALLAAPEATPTNTPTSRVASSPQTADPEPGMNKNLSGDQP